MMRRIGWLILLSISLWAIPALAEERLRASWSGASPANAPVWVALEKGLFKKHEIAVEMQSIGASTIAAQALLAGELDVNVSSVATLVSSRLAGSDVVAIFVSVPTFIDHIVTGPEIREVGDLRGKVGAVNRLGTTSDLGLRLALRRLGLDADKDVKLIALGDDAARLAGMKGGQVQFSILAEPWIREAEKLGFKSLLPIAKLGIPFHWNATVTDVYPVVPLPTPDGVATALAEEAKKRPEAAKANLAAFVDQSFVKELEATGFIASLYWR